MCVFLSVQCVVGRVYQFISFFVECAKTQQSSLRQVLQVMWQEWESNSLADTVSVPCQFLPNSQQFVCANLEVQC